MRWHPVAEEWKDAEEPLPDDEAALAEEVQQHEQEGSREAKRYASIRGRSSSISRTSGTVTPLANKLRGEGLPVKRRDRYLLVGAATEDDAIELGERLDSETPEGARIGVRGNPDDMPLPVFVNLSALKPGFLRDLGLQPPTQPAVIIPTV